MAEIWNNEHWCIVIHIYLCFDNSVPNNHTCPLSKTWLHCSPAIVTPSNVKSWTSEHLHWPVATQREQGSHCSCSQLAIMLSSPRSAAQATTVKPTESFVAECKGCVGLPLPICAKPISIALFLQYNSICTSKRISTLLQSTTMNKYKVHVRLELQCCSFEISLLPTQESVCWSNIGKQHSCKFKNYISANSSTTQGPRFFCLL